ncbi:MAG: GNAT family N-acetyltransferase [Nitrospira sp.]|nr:GNAT family N-acetyltransferase [Nitrospira sp.]MCP9441913.1 GNAT family N-acetyltransferase [Nitrospira sp.]
MKATLKPAILYSDDSPPGVDQLVRLFHQAPWAKDRTTEDAEEMLRHTDLAICAWDRERLVGFGRVLTDFVYRATIWDVIVDRAYQKQGIGSEIVRRILGHPRLRRVELFWLCTRRPGFYEKLGFSSQEQTGMAWARKTHARQE